VIGCLRDFYRQLFKLDIQYILCVIGLTPVLASYAVCVFSVPYCVRELSVHHNCSDVVNL
jgi:hypothetical protein